MMTKEHTQNIDGFLTGDCLRREQCAYYLDDSEAVYALLDEGMAH